MCEEDATSREHVPPICLFPEEKDIKTSTFRNNLITVPSCDIHNSKKSKDDEFLMGCLAGIIGNNEIGFFHAKTKVKRSLQRYGKDFIHALMTENRTINLKSARGYDCPVSVAKSDIDRLHSSFKHIAQGLFFHKFNERFEGVCHILIDFITYEDERIETYKLLCRNRLEIELSKSQTEGNNPEIFRYQFIKPDEFGLIGMQMTFYEGAKVFVAYQGKAVKKPQSLAAELIGLGVKTIVNFEDGSQFKFN
jgi:hypothetical protein